MKKIVLLLLAGFFTLAGNSQNKDSTMIKKIVDEVLINSTAYENLRKLCKEVGNRLSGSENYMKAVELTTKMLKEAGADTVYLQKCMVPHWERGKKESGEIILNNGKRISLNLIALGNSVGSGEKGCKVWCHRSFGSNFKCEPE